ncbi:F-box domain-containing protein [Saccharata proteae CBS 121410]|uniref:F-box domain-containing protein n=1 Tax=Saccharata proteae CBS 121410 TaxID=1314787 RepID=A0A9P4LVV8_9PEZI|nr:F-box domain-containing protein [Saccharata proteae CBS 121410]
MDHSSPFLTLPAELIQQIITYLSPVDLARLARTCRLLCTHAKDERFWKPFVLSNMPSGTITESPSSWRALYGSHHPYWFLSRRKLWFSDYLATGKLLIARYNARTNAIEAYVVTAERGQHTFELWEHNPEVIIHRFEPKVQLDLNAPVLRLDAAAYTSAVGPEGSESNILQKELRMNVHSNNSSRGLNSMFMLARPCPPEDIRLGTAVWPPQIIPASERTRNHSVSRYRSNGHKPSKLSQVSEATWRLRKWMEFTHHSQGMSMRVGEDVTTYATLDEELYTPTKQKPWRGIWVGDYSGHGCEFLVILQPDEPGPLPEGAQRVINRRNGSVSSAGSWMTAPSEMTPPEDNDEASSSMASSTTTLGQGNNNTPGSSDEDSEGSGAAKVREHWDDGTAAEMDEPEYSGRLEAIKLTGDPNIPRGEHTFIAPDVGPDGLIRVADEDIFRGARVVKSVGHIAARGFREDAFIPSQLILISHDRLAQYWETFGHISFYQRVDLDKLLRYQNP